MASQRDSKIAGIHGWLRGMNLAERSPKRHCSSAPVCDSNAHFGMSTLSSWSCRAPGTLLGAVACKLLSTLGRYRYTLR